MDKVAFGCRDVVSRCCRPNWSPKPPMSNDSGARITASQSTQPHIMPIYDAGEIAVWPRKPLCPKTVATWPGLGSASDVGGLR
jgi:hypothetical protein